MQQARIAAGSESPLSDLFAFGPMMELTAKVGDEPEIIKGQAVSAGYFPGLRLQVSQGRSITDEDDRRGAVPVVVLSNEFWEKRFGANPAVIGQQRHSQRVHRNVASELQTSRHDSVSRRTVGTG
jgi:hypothetical protein